MPKRIHPKSYYDAKAAQHTPGPWTVQPGSDVQMFQISTPSGFIAKLYDRPEEAANARLIAAAPDLLKSVELAHVFLDSLPEGWLGNISGDVGALNDFYLTSRPALAKAQSNTK